MLAINVEVHFASSGSAWPVAMKNPSTNLPSNGTQRCVFGYCQSQNTGLPKNWERHQACQDRPPVCLDIWVHNSWTNNPIWWFHAGCGSVFFDLTTTKDVCFSIWLFQSKHIGDSILQSIHESLVDYRLCFGSDWMFLIQHSTPPLIIAVQNPREQVLW